MGKVHELAFLWFGLPGPLRGVKLARSHRKQFRHTLCKSESPRRLDHIVQLDDLWVLDPLHILNLSPLASMSEPSNTMLGGHFGPEQKKLAPPPQKSPIRRRHHPDPSAPPADPPLWDFQ